MGVQVLALAGVLIGRRTEQEPLGVADGTGGHVFADTLDQHNVNVRKWYAIRHARGEM